MNWQQARTLAEDHQSRFSVTPAVVARKPRARRFSRTPDYFRLRPGAGRPARSLAA